MTTLVEYKNRGASTGAERKITLSTAVLEGDQIFYLQAWSDPTGVINATYAGAETIVAKTSFGSFEPVSFQLFKITATADNQQVYGPTLSASTGLCQWAWNLRNASALSLRTTGTNTSGGSAVDNIVAADAAIAVVADEFCIASAFNDGAWATTRSFTGGYTDSTTEAATYAVPGHKLIATPESTNCTITKLTGSNRSLISRLWVIATAAATDPTHPFTSVTIS